MLQDLIGLTEEQFIIFFLAFVRISALISIAPFFGSRVIPVKVRVFVSFFLTIVIVPMLKQHVHIENVTLIELFPLTMKEAFLGMFLVFNAKLFFESFSFAGRVIGRQMGLGLSQLIDPESGSQVTPIGTIYGMTAILLFLLFNGHHILLSALYRSFDLIPITAMFKVTSASLIKMLTIFNTLFVLGLKLAAPAIVILFVLDASMGIVARIVPQMNIFFVGLPVKLGVGLFAVILSLPVFYLLFQTMFSLWGHDINGLLNHF